MRARAANSAPALRSRGDSVVAASAATRRSRDGSGRLKRTAWVLHRTLGLGFAALILLMSLTGGTLVMHDAIERLVEPGHHIVDVPADSARVPLAGLLRTVAAEAPAGYRPLRLLLGRYAHDAEQLLFVAPDGRTRWTAIVNPYTGAVLWRGADQSLVTPWLLALHMHLHAGGWGHLVTGLGGVALFLLGLTGLYIHGERLGAIWRSPIRFDRGARAAFSDLHGWLGLASIYFSLMLGLTGTIYAIKVAPGQIAAPPPPPAPFDLAQLAPLEPMLAATRARFTDGELLRVSFPAGAKAPLTVLVLHRDAPVWRKFSRVDFDPATGETRAVRDAAAATPFEKFSAMLGPLHFGFYGSPFVKWLYVLGGYSPAILALSGVALWWLRRRTGAA